MVIQLTNPQPADLGFASPALGPWFSSDLSLGEPDRDLGVAVNFGNDDSWLPPTAGLLSLFIAEPERPYGLAGLRKPDGSAAFSDGRTVAVFRLLPQVEEQLQALSRFLPPLTAAPPTGDPTAAAAPTRARVRTFALELAPTLVANNPDPYITTIGNLIVPEYPGYITNGLSEARAIRTAKAAYLGLQIPKDGTEVVKSGTRPMFDLKRPGQFSLSGGGSPPAPEKLLTFPGGMSTRLFVFDERGLPLEPGAVAAWWQFLATSAFSNLWAQGFTGADQRIASRDGGARFTVHFVNPHGGPLPNEHPLMQRVQVTGVSALPDASDPRNLRSSTTGGVSVSFSAPGAGGSPDNAPFPRATLQPEGRFVSTVQAWVGDWTSFSINRDFVQIGLVEVESHLVGVPRLLPAATGNDVTRRRAADQNRVTTRVNVTRAVGEIFLPSIDTAAASVLAVLSGAGTGTLVTSAADRDYGPLSPLAALPTGNPPDEIPEFSAAVPSGAEELMDTRGRRVGVVHPLAGGERLFLVELGLGTALAGAWVRVWAQDFSTTTGSRTRLDGGAGRASSSGQVFVVIQMEEGATGTASPSGLDLLIKTADGTREYPDLRFDRPASPGGNPIALSSASTVIACETGQTLTTAGLADAIPPGITLVALAGEGRATPALVDRTSIPSGAFALDTLVRVLAGGDRLALAQPAFVKQPDGSITSSFNGIQVQRFVRSGADRILDGTAFAAGAPLPAQEWLEIVAARIDASGSGVASGAMTSGPALARFHELLPHQEGHPGAPGAAEFHGGGVALSGAAGLLLAEYVRERQARLTSDLLRDAFDNPFPALAEPPAGDAATWTAVLRTAGKGSAGEPSMDALADVLVEPPATAGTLARDTERWVQARNIADDTSGLPADARLAATALNVILATLPPSGPGQERSVASTARALDRRLQASRGIREGALSVLAAIRRAEEYIYIETPALDNLACGTGDESIEILSAIRERLNDSAHRALKLILCLPLKYSPFVPTPMQSVRDSLLKTAAESLRSIPHFDQRVAIITPNAATGRSLFLCSTTVIIDDAYLLVGSTHLWRRGLSFDVSVAAALFDERVEGGRSRRIREARRRLIANRVGLAEALLPDNPTDLMVALRLLPGRDGGRRLTTRGILATTAATETGDAAVWNPDASPGTVFNLANYLASLVAIRNHVPPPV